MKRTSEAAGTWRSFAGLVLAMGVVLLACSFLNAQERGFGLGFIAGEPTGLSMKGWLSATSAMDAGLAWSFSHETSYHIHADYLLHQYHVFETRETIPVYYGIGGRLKTGRHEDARLGVRMVGGIGYIFRDAPIDLFLEIAPVLDVAPSTDLSLNAGFGARFFFR